MLDFDGTLVHSDPAHLAAFNRILEPYGLLLDAAKFDRIVSGRTNHEIFRDILPETSDHDIDFLSTRVEQLYLASSEDVTLDEGAVPLIEAARRSGMSVSIVTNAPRVITDVLLARFRIKHLFDFCITRDDVGTGKPNPAPYQHALALSKTLPVDAWAVEDSLSGVLAAVRANIATIGIGKGDNIDPLKRAGATAVIETLLGAKGIIGI